ncbi:Six-hairpin glycosidase-like protein [Xylariaceae sp. FL0662B]|nr:Six-hairpin glycosidase-like protein [Xylariaceae sp. FL0662B]
MTRQSYNTFIPNPRSSVKLGDKSIDRVNSLPLGYPPRNKRDSLPSKSDYFLLKIVVFISIIGALLVLTRNVLLQPPSRLRHQEIVGTAFLDHDDPISAFAGKTFLKDNIPFIDIPDSLVQDVYYYRWTSIQRNIRYIKPGIGYMFTEFVQPVGYAKVFGSIDAAAGHQIDEARWLRDTSFADDYIQLYTRGPADSLQYTQWILDAMSRRAMVTGDHRFLSTQLDDMVRVWHQWDGVFDTDAGLYYYKPVWDAQELSLPGFVADPNGTNPTLRMDGPDTFRPSHNAYMVANARAIATAASLARDGFREVEFTMLADDLESAMYQRMWAPEQQFFMDIIRPGNPNLTRLTGREQVGLFPYRFGIGLNKTYAQPAVDSMFDPEGFWAPFGPTTLEIRDPWFMAEKPIEEYCCYWNGMSWPYSTGHTLKSLAAIYRAGTTNVTAEQYFEYLRKYARTQQKDGHPYVAESHYPFRDTWSADAWNHSEHYDHSTNNDDVITGLFGILPQKDDILSISPIAPKNWTYFALENLPYHGHLVTVLYDEQGSRYNIGAGLTVFIDGKKVHNSAKKTASVSVPPPVLPANELVNIAVNPVGPGHYPTADATYTNPGDFQFKAIDGVLFYDTIPDNRWTNYGSPNMNDTLTITFARPRNVSSITLALFSDVARGGGIDLPARIEIYGSDGLIATVHETSTLLRNDRNEVRFQEIETQVLAINFYRKSPEIFVGVCELQVWTPVPRPVYYAVDAHLTGRNTRVMFHKSSTATANGAVVGSLGSDSNVAFSGIESDGGRTTLTLTYSNSGNSTVEVSVEVNQVFQTTLNLLPSKGKYVNVTADIMLAAGKNYLTIRGGSDDVDVKLETMTIF